MLDWDARAACNGLDTAIFFPPKGHSTMKAKAICARCPVRAECLDEAFRIEQNEVSYGVRGGLTAQRRRDLIRRGVTAGDAYRLGTLLAGAA